MTLDYGELVAASQAHALRAALAANSHLLSRAADVDHAGEFVSTRRASYRGHEIVVRTSYEITVSGRPFNVHVTVDNAGRVHYHGLPTQDFPSVISLVKKAIDVFGDEFDAEAALPREWVPSAPSGPTRQPNEADPDQDQNQDHGAGNH